MKCWIDVTTDGLIEDVIVKPGQSTDVEDSVYYIIQRTINGATVRYREKMALESGVSAVRSINRPMPLYQARSHHPQPLPALTILRANRSSCGLMA